MNILTQLRSALAGRYEIEREIGAGGMATVFIARDTKHHRNVALKVMKPELGSMLGGERFLSEIRVTASLQHPNLLPLFDSGEADGLLFYVMPFIEGESLRAKLDREKQLPIDDAVRIATSVASALDYAHRHGVVHRDLKPENILLHDGQPVIADFGIALAIRNAGGSRITQSGLSLGTPQYMSPEQATADRTIDGRTDIYSLGAVLYEMLVGDPPHTASTAQALIAQVLIDKPRSVRVSRASVPLHIDAAIERSLEKVPADRWATAHEFAEALAGSRAAYMPSADAVTELMTGNVKARGVARSGSRGARARLPWAVAVLGILLGGAGIVNTRSAAAPAQRVHFALTFSDSANLRADVSGSLFAVSPDGSQLAYVGGTRQRIYIRPLDDLTARPVVGTENGYSPQFSPDGKWLAFVSNNILKKVPLTSAGGPAVTIAGDVLMFSWGDRDVIVIARTVGANTGLWRVSPDGGAPERITTIDSKHGESLHSWPHVLPGGTSVAFNTNFGNQSDDSIAVVDLSDHNRITRLPLQGTAPRYSASGHLLFGRLDGTLDAVAFDAKTLKVLGAVLPVEENLQVQSGTYAPPQFAIGNNGTLIYARGRTTSELDGIDRQSHARPLLKDVRNYSDMRFSPDGKRLAMTIQSGTTRDVWIEDLAGGTLTQVTRDGTSDRPSWTTDGKRIAWRAAGTKAAFDVKWAPVDASANAEVLVQDAWSVVFAPGEKFMMVNTLRSKSGSDIDMVIGDGAHTRTPFVNTPAGDGAQRISPDGKWLAYVSNQTGRNEVYVKAISDGTGVHQISTDGGSEPAWSASGREIFYRTPGAKIVAAEIAAGGEFNVTGRATLFDDVYRIGIYYGNFDVAPDGKTFAMVRPAGAAEPPVVMLGWSEELKERMKSAVKPR